MSQRLLSADAFESSRSWERFEALLLGRDVPGYARREASAQEHFDREAAVAEAEQEEGSEELSTIPDEPGSSADDEDSLYSD